MALITDQEQKKAPTSVSQLQAAGNLAGTTTGNGYSFSGNASDAARFMAPVAKAAPTQPSAGPGRVTSGSDFAKKEEPTGPVMLGPESGLGWKTRLAKYQADSESARNAATNSGLMAREGMSQTGANFRQVSSEKAQANLQGQRIGADFGLQDQRAGTELNLQQRRIDAANSLAGTQHKYDLEKLAEGDKFGAAAAKRLLGAQGILAGGNEAVGNNLINNQAGFNGDVSGFNIPLKNNQVDQYQFITQDNGAGKGQTVLAGNKSLGIATPVNGAAAALAGATQQPAQGTQRVQNPQQAQPPAPVQTPAQGNNTAPNAFTSVYQKNPGQLQADVDFAHNSLGTVHKTDEEQFQYLNNMRTSNPTLYNAVKMRIAQANQR
jgi:hypothetical protein